MNLVTPEHPIKFRQLWDCCWGNETHVAEFFEDDGVTPAFHAICKTCASSFIGETREITADELATFSMEPRRAGDLCYGGYWGGVYLVLETTDTSITVLNLTAPNEILGKSGNTLNVKTHMTAWDWRRDRMIARDLMETWAHVDQLVHVLTHLAEEYDDSLTRY